MSLKARLTEAMKDAMRAQDKDRLGVVRMALTAFKQIEVDAVSYTHLRAHET